MPETALRSAIQSIPGAVNYSPGKTQPPVPWGPIPLGDEPRMAPVNNYNAKRVFRPGSVLASVPYWAPCPRGHDALWHSELRGNPWEEARPVTTARFDCETCDPEGVHLNAK
jgi:hypothetical protein